MAVTWRYVPALVAVVGFAAVAGAVPAAAAESHTARCTADRYRADATVKYRKLDSDVYIGSVALTIDDRAGQRNRVRLAVRSDDETAFTYTSGPNVTAGPYLFDYSDNPIKVAPPDGEEIQVEVTVEFDTKGRSETSCTATVTI